MDEDYAARKEQAERLIERLQKTIGEFCEEEEILSGDVVAALGNTACKAAFDAVDGDPAKAIPALTQSNRIVQECFAHHINHFAIHNQGPTIH